MIAIQSNKNLMFPPSHRGIVTMEIDLIQNRPREEMYEMRIIDSCHIDVEEEYTQMEENGTKEVPNPEFQINPDAPEFLTVPNYEEVTKTRTVKKQIGKDVYRTKKMSYTELDQLAQILQVDMTDTSGLRENINELFRQGLLLITQQECQAGEGNYFSEAQDWEIIR